MENFIITNLSYICIILLCIANIVTFINYNKKIKTLRKEVEITNNRINNKSQEFYTFCNDVTKWKRSIKGKIAYRNISNNIKKDNVNKSINTKKQNKAKIG